MKNKKILFIHVGSFSHINEAFLLAFREIFSEYDIDTIDLNLFIKKMSFKENIKLTLKSLFSRKKLNQRSLKGIDKKSGSFFQLTNDLIREVAQKQSYVFSIQTQSNYNCNLGYCPHYIYTDHTHLVNLRYPDFDQKFLNPKNWIESETNLYKNAAGIFTMSSHVKNSLYNQYQIDPKKVKCVFAGANLSQADFHYSLKRYQKKNILFVGVDWERKGGPQLFEAFKIIKLKHPDVNLDIVGCSPDIQHPNVNIWGRLPIQEVEIYYKSASLFCMPSKREPFGIVYLEAMAYKLPIVALNIGALPDFVEDGKNGFLLDYLDIQGMASKLIYLLENPELSQEMGEYAYQKVKQQYQWEKSVASIREHIEKQGILN